jgi:hypothetical protein
MSAIVYGKIPGTLGYSAIASAAPVRGINWRDCADAVNYLLGGRSRSIIPVGGGFGSLPLATTRTLRWTIWPSYQATHRVWTIGLSGGAADEAAPNNITFTDPSGVSSLHPGSSVRDDRRFAFQHIETIDTRTASETAISVTLANAGSLAGIATSVSCFEVCRPDLTIDTNDLGLEAYSFAGGIPIYDGAGYSLGALPESLAGALSLRRTLHQWSVPTADAVTWTGAGALFGYDPPLLDRFLYRGETVVTVPVRVYTRSSVTTTGTIDFAMTSGDTLSIPITANDTGTWRSGSIDVRAEDLSTSNGVRTALDRCTITGTRTSGAGSLYCEAISIAGRDG